VSRGAAAVPTPGSEGRRRVALADLSLFMVAVVWGFNFVVIKDAIGRMDPMLYTMLRYAVGYALLAAGLIFSGILIIETLSARANGKAEAAASDPGGA
jgi:drug/metabolite transporter (DMT)-like permease